jgi:PKD repeat protein
MDKKAENETMEIVLTLVLVSVVGIIAAVAGMTVLKAPQAALAGAQAGSQISPGETPRVPEPAETRGIPAGMPVSETTPAATGSPTAAPTPRELPPGVQFTADTTGGPAPLSVQFADRSTGSPTAWTWDFGDGSASDQQNPAHTYTVPGVYSVTLTAANANGNARESKAGFITVTAQTFDMSAVVPVIECVRDNGNRTFTAYFGYRNDLPTPVAIPVGANNSFTPGQADRGQPTVFQPGIHFRAVAVVFESHEVAWKIGSRTASAFTGSAACPMPPAAKFHAYPLSGKAPLKVSFSDDSSGSPTGWSWSFGSADTSTEKNPSYLYLKPGTYTVTLAVRNAYGEDTLTKTAYILVTG